MFGGMPGAGGGKGGDPFGNMFNPQNMAKLMAHPKTSKYFADPQFKNLIEFCKQQP